MYYIKLLSCRTIRHFNVYFHPKFELSFVEIYVILKNNPFVVQHFSAKSGLVDDLTLFRFIK